MNAVSNPAPQASRNKEEPAKAVTPERTEALIHMVRADFWCFVEVMFPVLYPGKKLVFAKYLEVIATLLMSVASGNKRDVIINLPPRHMKSALASVLFPAWALGQNPSLQFICISYNDGLAHDLSAQTRKIMQSSLYKLIFPQTILEKNAVDHIRTTRGGHRYATAVGSHITGFGADILIIDDPMQPEDALSQRVKEETRKWVDSSALTRFNDPSKGAMILVMHRLAPDDLSATLATKSTFVLRLPLIADQEDKFERKDRLLMHRPLGAPLNPARLDASEIDRLRAKIVPHVFEAQYQQRPRPLGSGYCSIDRLSRYRKAPPFELIVHSWDLAATRGGGDWTVCAKFGLARNAEGRDAFYLTGIVRMQVESPVVREAIIEQDRLDKPALIVMDGNGIGRPVYQELLSMGFRHILPGGSMAGSISDNSKVRRFSEALHYLYDGIVMLPEAMPGLDAVLDEIAAFPDGKHDDQVDALSYVAAHHAQVADRARLEHKRRGG